MALELNCGWKTKVWLGLEYAKDKGCTKLQFCILVCFFYWATWSMFFLFFYFFVNQRNGSYLCKVKLNLSFCAPAPQCPPCCICTIIKLILQNVLILFLYLYRFIIAGYKLEVTWGLFLSVHDMKLNSDLYSFLFIFPFFALVFVLGPLEMGCSQVCLGV